MMPWLLMEPGHHQARYCLHKNDRLFSIWSLDHITNYHDHKHEKIMIFYWRSQGIIRYDIANTRMAGLFLLSLNTINLRHFNQTMMIMDMKTFSNFLLKNPAYKELQELWRRHARGTLCARVLSPRIGMAFHHNINPATKTQTCLQCNLSQIKFHLRVWMCLFSYWHI